MNLIAAQEIKRRGMAAVDGMLADGPIRVLKNNRSRYVIMSEADFGALMADLAEARLAASEADLKAGRVQKGSAANLMAAIHAGD
jgi:PHD/YefM family antitoxin component YafN of YafNO toxin-antitoxin module